MKRLFSCLIILMSVSSAFSQVLIDKPIQLNGIAGQRSITNLEVPVNGTDAANKAYVDNKVATAGGLTAENSNSANTTSTWSSSNTSSDWEDITLWTHTVTGSGRYLVFASFEGIDGDGGTVQYIRVNANGIVSASVAVGARLGSFQPFSTPALFVELSAGNVVKLQNQNQWNYCCRDQIRNIKFSLLKVQ